MYKNVYCTYFTCTNTSTHCAETYHHIYMYMQETSLCDEWERVHLVVHTNAHSFSVSVSVYRNCTVVTFLPSFHDPC